MAFLTNWYTLGETPPTGSTITMGAKGMQEPSVWAEAPTIRSHHQGSEPTQSTNKGCPAPSVKSTVLVVPPEQVGYQRHLVLHFAARLGSTQHVLVIGAYFLQEYLNALFSLRSNSIGACRYTP